MDYDLNQLSPYEFENLSRDLVEIWLGGDISFESFAPGKDGGIDFRYTETNKLRKKNKDFVEYDQFLIHTNTIILQCKRYTSFTALRANLRKEFEKVERLAPKRYILTISIDLTPFQKKEIFDIFKGYLKSAADILTRSDLNKILADNRKIEEKYYKLWLSSTHVLERILHSKIINYSKFELTQLADTVKLYVENNSYNTALKILEDNHFLLITGLPGVGKTTLARILLTFYIKYDYEFIFVSRDISEAFSMFNENQKQVFYFDDFLGSNFHKTLLSKNEDRRLLDFLKVVSNSPNSRLILTSRQYIYQQAGIYYDFMQEVMDSSKFELNLDQYNSKINFHILYNHLFFSNLSEKQILSVYQEEAFSEIISHRNFTPRIIEFATKENFYKNTDEEDYINQLRYTIKHPFFIWEKPFYQELRGESRLLLLVILLADETLNQDELFNIVQSYARKIPYLITEDHYLKECLKEITGTFVFDREGLFTCINPSVKDFLINHLTRNKQDVINLIHGLDFLDYLLFAFLPEGSFVITGAIPLDNEQSYLLEKKIVKEFHNLPVSKANCWHINPLLQKLDMLTKKFKVEKFKLIKKLLIIEIGKIDGMTLNNIERVTYMSVLSALKFHIKIDFIALFNRFSKKVETINDLVSFSYFKKILPSEFNQFLDVNENFYWSIYECVKQPSYFGSTREELQAILKIEIAYGVNLSMLKLDLMEEYRYGEEKIVFGSFNYLTLDKSSSENLRSVFYTIFQKFALDRPN